MTNNLLKKAATARIASITTTIKTVMMIFFVFGLFCWVFEVVMSFLCLPGWGTRREYGNVENQYGFFHLRHPYESWVLIHRMNQRHISGNALPGWGGFKGLVFSSETWALVWEWEWRRQKRKEKVRGHFVISWTHVPLKLNDSVIVFDTSLQCVTRDFFQKYFLKSQTLPYKPSYSARICRLQFIYSNNRWLHLYILAKNVR